jgi:hypothetical protein
VDLPVSVYRGGDTILGEVVLPVFEWDEHFFESKLLFLRQLVFDTPGQADSQRGDVLGHFINDVLLQVGHILDGDLVSTSDVLTEHDIDALLSRSDHLGGA